EYLRREVTIPVRAGKMEYPTGAESCHRYGEGVRISSSVVRARLRGSLAQLRSEHRGIWRRSRSGWVGRAYRGVPERTPLHYSTLQQYAGRGIDASWNRQRQFLYGSRSGLHHRGTPATPHKSAARKVFIRFARVQRPKM